MWTLQFSCPISPNTELSDCVAVGVSRLSAAGDGGSRRLPDVEKLAAEEPEEHEL